MCVCVCVCVCITPDNLREKLAEDIDGMALCGYWVNRCGVGDAPDRLTFTIQFSFKSSIKKWCERIQVPSIRGGLHEGGKHLAFCARMLL